MGKNLKVKAYWYYIPGEEYPESYECADGTPSTPEFHCPTCDNMLSTTSDILKGTIECTNCYQLCDFKTVQIPTPDDWEDDYL